MFRNLKSDQADIDFRKITSGGGEKKAGIIFHVASRVTNGSRDCSSRKNDIYPGKL